MKNKKNRLVSILTPLESNVYSKLEFYPLSDSFGVERVFERINFYKHAIPLGLGSILTPLESNVYSKMGFHPLSDSFGVERVFERINFYKHAIPLGLGFQKCHTLFIFYS